MTIRTLNMHGNVIAVGEKGVLFVGRSGTGKSSLSLALLDNARRVGIFSALVADDRVILSVAAGRVLARCIKGFEGLIEQRGVGIMRVRHEPQIIVHLVVELIPRHASLQRFPEEDRATMELLGERLPVVKLDLKLGLELAIHALWRKLGFDSPRNVRQLVISLDHCAALHKNVPINDL